MGEVMISDPAHGLGQEGVGLLLLQSFLPLINAPDLVSVGSSTQEVQDDCPGTAPQPLQRGWAQIPGPDAIHL